MLRTNSFYNEKDPNNKFGFSDPHPFMPPIHGKYGVEEEDDHRSLGDVYYKIAFIININTKMDKATQKQKMTEAKEEIVRILKSTDDGKRMLSKWKFKGEQKIIFKAQNSKSLFKLRNEAKLLHLVQCMTCLRIKSDKKPTRKISAVLAVFGETARLKLIAKGLKCQ